MKNFTYFGNMELTKHNEAWQVKLNCKDENDQGWEIVLYDLHIQDAAQKAWEIYKSGDWSKHGKITQYREEDIMYEVVPFGQKSFGQLIIQSKDDKEDWRSFVNFKDNKGKIMEHRGYGKNAQEAAIDALDKYNRHHNKNNKAMIM